MHSPHTEEWTLRIRYAQKKDSGVYEVSDGISMPNLPDGILQLREMDLTFLSFFDTVWKRFDNKIPIYSFSISVSDFHDATRWKIRSFINSR